MVKLHMFNKILDFLADNRNPLFFLPNYIRKIQLENKLRNIEIPKSTEVNFALTFDVEYDYGSVGNKTDACVGPFLEQITKLLEKEKIPATFFVQGSSFGKI